MKNSNSISGTIVGLFIGKPQSRWPGKPSSAIGKHSVDGPLAVQAQGLAGDQQADLTVHGGPEKAIHHYAYEHMDFWRDMFPEKAELFEPGLFGENISTTGLTEELLCVGDILMLGSAKVQICQGRQPCWKLNSHTGIEQMAARFQRTGRTGWYYRVLESGAVKVHDRITLLERVHPNWTLKRLIHARFDPNLDCASATDLSELATLSQSWRGAFAKKRVRGSVEDTDRRLKGT